MRARAIMYHDVVENNDFASSGFPGEGANLYKLRREDFELHLDAIRTPITTIHELRDTPPVIFLRGAGGRVMQGVRCSLDVVEV